MGRAEVAAVVQHVLQQCGASCLIDIADLIEDDDGRAHILSVHLGTWGAAGSRPRPRMAHKDGRPGDVHSFDIGVHRRSRRSSSVAEVAVVESTSFLICDYT